jgi:hypothetical protein
LKLLLVLALCAAAYLVGVYQGYTRDWPARRIKGILVASLDRGMVQTDRFGRLLRFPGKIEVACPAQDRSTAVLLAIGQSNAANFQGQRYRGIDDRVINYFNGRCYLASSPLLGADGKEGESWTLLGNKLVKAGVYDRVIIIAAGVGSSSVARWAAGGDLNAMLRGVLLGVRGRYTITHVLWQQGATDADLHTSEQDYAARLRSLISTLHEEGVTAPFYVSKSSLQLSKTWSPDNPVTRAQDAVVDGRSVLAGPNTDRDVSALDRFDGLHFSASGQEKFTDAWLELLRPPTATRP